MIDPGKRNKRLYTTKEAAEYLGRSEGGVRGLIREGHLPRILQGRRVHVDVLDMNAFVEKNRIVRLRD